MIKTNTLTKVFGDTTAVHNLNLEIPEGELFAFIGPNGAGKSTTIKMLVGLLRPTGGEALIGGYSIQDNPVNAKKLIGYIPDFPYLYEKLTGKEFMRFISRIYGLPLSEMDNSIDYYLNFFGLGNLANDLIKNYSHGYRQRLVFASALSTNRW
jgi:ABC-2 type transport system ATP-binding protein